MDRDTKELVASALVNAYYAGQERRQGFLGTDRRESETIPEETRNFRSPTITPCEVFEVYERFLEMLDQNESDSSDEIPF